MISDQIFEIVRSKRMEIIAESHKAVDELAALMCYREMKAYCKGRSVFLKVPNLIVALFKEDYPEQTIREAIEKVKNEMK